jgi:hypothetical protein
VTRREGPAASATATSGGVGVCGAFALVFTILKLTGFITWSWWAVLAPLWVPTAFALLALIAGAVLWIALSGGRDRERRTPDAPLGNEHGPRRRWGPRRG